MYAYPRRRPPLADTLREFVALLPRQPLTFQAARAARQGDGTPILVLPPFLRGDGYTTRFRNHLSLLGYTVLPWGLGLNRGPRLHTLDALGRQIRTLADQHGPLRVVGFGVGGLAARWASHRAGPAMRQVVTINAPFTAPLDSAWFNARDLTWLWPDVDLATLTVLCAQPPELPWATLYSTSGLIAWQACVDTRFPERCAPLPSRHTLAPFEAGTLSAVAHCLADPDGLPPAPT